MLFVSIYSIQALTLTLFDTTVLFVANLTAEKHQNINPQHNLLKFNHISNYTTIELKITWVCKIAP